MTHCSTCGRRPSERAYCANIIGCNADESKFADVRRTSCTDPIHDRADACEEMAAQLKRCADMLQAVAGDIEDGWDLGSVRGKYVLALIRCCDEARSILSGSAHRAVAGTSLVCTECGCRWKRHADRTHQLYDADQRPCAKCDNAPNPPLRYETKPITASLGRRKRNDKRAW